MARAKRQILGARAILVCVSSLVLHSKVQWRFILLSASQITGWKQLSQSQASIPAVAQQMVRVYREITWLFQLSVSKGQTTYGCHFWLAR